MKYWDKMRTMHWHDGIGLKSEFRTSHIFLIGCQQHGEIPEGEDVEEKDFHIVEDCDQYFEKRFHKEELIEALEEAIQWIKDQ